MDWGTFWTLMLQFYIFCILTIVPTAFILGITESVKDSKVERDRKKKHFDL
jgi:hypothetical protein